jgi:hypothetical protein
MKKPPDTTLAASADYRQFVEELKSRVTSARISAARAITHEAILLYWDIGCGIVGEGVLAQGWVWITKLDDFMRISEREILTHAGRVSHEAALGRAEAEFEKFRRLEDAKPSPVEEHFLEAIKQVKRLEKGKPAPPPR